MAAGHSQDINTLVADVQMEQDETIENSARLEAQVSL